jgi:hypothetical protein
MVGGTILFKKFFRGLNGLRCQNGWPAIGGELIWSTDTVF